jgi:hypothetical protein
MNFAETINNAWLINGISANIAKNLQHDILCCQCCGSVLYLFQPKGKKTYTSFRKISIYTYCPNYCPNYWKLWHLSLSRNIKQWRLALLWFHISKKTFLIFKRVYNMEWNPDPDRHQNNADPQYCLQQQNLSLQKHTAFYHCSRQ